MHRHLQIDELTVQFSHFFPDLDYTQLIFGSKRRSDRSILAAIMLYFHFFLPFSNFIRVRL